MHACMIRGSDSLCFPDSTYAQEIKALEGELSAGRAALAAIARRQNIAGALR